MLVVVLQRYEWRGKNFIARKRKFMDRKFKQRYRKLEERLLVDRREFSADRTYTVFSTYIFGLSPETHYEIK